jgi:hypothetical protein
MKKYNNHIIFYNINDINNSSFFITGFQQNANKYDYKFTVLNKIPNLILDKIMDGIWRNKLYQILLLKVITLDKSFFICIDTRDTNTVDFAKGIYGYHLPLLEKVNYYFKVNYNIEAINNCSYLKEYRPKISPVLPFFPLKLNSSINTLYTLFPKIIPRKGAPWSGKDILRQLKSFYNVLSIDQIKQMRNTRKDLDIFFVSNFYSEKEALQDMDFRYNIMEELKKYDNIKSIVGFASKTELPGKFSNFSIKRFYFKDYLKCISRSRLSIYVRGVDDCISFKFGELLSLGMPIVGQTIFNNKENIMNNPYFQDQFAFDDPIKIVQETLKLLNNPDKLMSLGASNANTFDSKFTPEAVVSNLMQYLNFNGK